MARIQGLEPQQAGWLTRLLYWFTRRSMRKITGQDRLPEPAKIVAHHPRFLRGRPDGNGPGGRADGGSQAQGPGRPAGFHADRLSVLNGHSVLPWAEKKV